VDAFSSRQGKAQGFDDVQSATMTATMALRRFPAKGAD